MYRRTVRGDTRIPSFTSSSDAIRSSPHVRFAPAMSAIKSRRSAGNRGRPRGIDFHRQNSRNPLRCHRMSVSGFTTVRSRRQSMSRDSATSVIRVASSARRGLTCRSKYNANCLRRNRFSGRAGHVAATSTTRIAGRRQPRARSCGRRGESVTGPCCGMLPLRPLVLIERRHEDTLYDPCSAAPTGFRQFGQISLGIYFLRTTACEGRARSPTRLATVHWSDHRDSGSRRSPSSVRTEGCVSTRPAVAPVLDRGAAKERTVRRLVFFSR